MKSLIIRIERLDTGEAKKTITVPGMMLKFATKVLPANVSHSLEEKGIDPREIVKLASDPDVHGVIAEIEDHEKNEKIIVSLK